MSFEEFARYLQQLEGTSSRLTMTQILAQMWREATPEEAKLMAYLSAGRLGPAYANPDTGLADKQVLKAIKLLGGEDAEKIFKTEGDLGKTAERIKQRESGTKGGKLGIEQVYKRLLQIAEAGGEGSQEKKIRLLSDLAREADPVSAKYIVKIVLGKLRTGFSDMTVLDSLSWMLTGDKKLREEIEGIYNVRADLGEVAEMIKKHKGVRGLSVDPEVGTPVLVARAERAKSVAEIWERDKESAAEHKLDGLRIQGHVKGNKVTLFSRGMENVTAMYPEITEGLKKQVEAVCILDGEMIAVDRRGKYLPFQETVQRKRKYGIEEMMAIVPLKYYVFDVLSASGKSYLDEPNSKRWQKLEEVVKKGEVVRLMPRRIVRSEEELEEFFQQALAAGTEGVVVKKLDGVYRSGSRDFNWIKYKKSYDKSALSDTIDAVVMGYDAGQGKRAGFGIGDFLIGVYEKKTDKYKTVAKIGTGLTDEEWRQIKDQCSRIKVQDKPENFDVTKQMACDVWVKPKIVVEILADEITKSPMHSSGWALRFPRLVSFREKQPEDTTSIEELNRLFKLQKK